MIIQTRVDGTNVIIDVQRMKLYGIIMSNRVILTSLCSAIVDEDEATELGLILGSLFRTYHCDLTHYTNLLSPNAVVWSTLPIMCTFTSYNKQLEPVQLKVKGVANIIHWLSTHNIADYEYKIEI